ncbi:Alpha-aminoadipate--LysW ligase LysX [Aquisphaera giovannonii]|uniref:Alpha-aminoadipate--LysW ligase LysX n=1 Tax=Aquisphaera giovannonii TaxID=406548 RepID=A0A5B9WAS0_9BACT|nr:RimK family alpha-L-glutamate ligase [Aquisphaera giovannonii]QEH37339.1 Alpha-aminoadipate--LysW ligase LysX [Aquisphaera giovannonii]
MPTPTIAALASGFGWHVTDLLRAAELLGVRLEVAPFPEVSARVGGGPARVGAGKIDLTGLDGVLVRMMPPGTLEQVVFRMDALHRVAAAGVPVWNPPRAIEAAVDKYLTLATLDQHGIAVPATWVGQSAEDALRAFEELGGDVVIKPLFGSEGRGILRVSDREIAWRSVHALERLGAVLYLQRFVRHPGHDVRAFVLRGRVLAAMRRSATGGEWRTNVSLGGRAEPARLDRAADRLALAAAQAIGAEVAGVDLVEDLDRDELVVLEVNAVPGWKALSAVTKVDAAAAILEALRDQAR